MSFIDVTSKGLRPRISFFCYVWIGYGFYYYGINWLNGSGITALEVAFSLPVFILIAHGVYVIIDRLLAKRYRLMGTAVLLAFYAAVLLLTHWLANPVNGLLDEPLQDRKSVV